MSSRRDKSSRSDWRDADHYIRLRRIDRAGLMWEWLRRDPDYVDWYQHSRSAAAPALSTQNDPVRWGIHFAERPEVEAPDARIIWHADFDPGTVRVVARSIDRCNPNAIDMADLAPWLTVVTDRRGEHAVLSDGWHHIRVDVEQGTLTDGGSVILHYQLQGVASAHHKVLSLRRLVDLCRTRRFALSLYPPDKRMSRWLLALRVHDALQSGASHGEIADVLFCDASNGAEAARRADSLRSRVRRLSAEARRLASGGYRALMKQSD